MCLKLNKKVSEVLKNAKEYDDITQGVIDDVLLSIRSSAVSAESQYILVTDLSSLIFSNLNRGQSIPEILGENPIDYVNDLISEMTLKNDLLKYDMKSENFLLYPAFLLFLNFLYSVFQSLRSGAPFTEVSLSISYLLYMYIVFVFATIVVKCVAIGNLSRRKLRFDILALWLAGSLLASLLRGITIDAMIQVNSFILLFIIFIMVFASVYVNKVVYKRIE